ncbi:MAG: hypothetical protein NUW01_08840 [Gemmatimonadaceae bacterium]|nr:hypothetical protein [Gemmatimonadaceae bacterium]
MADPTPRPQLALTGRGLLTQSWEIVQSTSGRAITSQLLQGTLIGLRAGDRVTGLVFCNQAQRGIGTAPTLIEVSLYQTDGTQLVTSGNIAAQAEWTASSNVWVPAPFTAVYTVPTDDDYYGTFLQNGTWGSTQMQLAGVAASSINGTAVGSGAKVAVQQATQATAPASATFAANTGNVVFWCAPY